jgi:predicted RNase H-like HicB family nuclease
MTKRVEDWLDLPWRLHGPYERMVGREPHYVVGIRELPDFFVVGSTVFEAFHQVRPALRAYLTHALQNGREIRPPAA